MMQEEYIKILLLQLQNINATWELILPEPIKYVNS